MAPVLVASKVFTRVLMQGPPIKVADLNTPIPAAAGNFTDFSNERSAITPSIDAARWRSSARAAVASRVSSLQLPQEPIIPPNPVRIADTSTAIPVARERSHRFTHPGIPAQSNHQRQQRSFLRRRFGGQQGVYVLDYVANNGPPIKIADTATGHSRAAPVHSHRFPQEPFMQRQ